MGTPVLLYRSMRPEPLPLRATRAKRPMCESATLGGRAGEAPLFLPSPPGRGAGGEGSRSTGFPRKKKQRPLDRLSFRFRLSASRAGPTAMPPDPATRLSRIQFQVCRTWQHATSLFALKGLHNIAQGRDRRERTLGQDRHVSRTLKGFYRTTVSRVDPIQGSG